MVVSDRDRFRDFPFAGNPLLIPEDAAAENIGVDTEIL